MQQLIVNIKENNSINLPPSIMAEAQLHANDSLEVVYKNGFIVLRPAMNFLPTNPKNNNQPDDILSYAGLFRGAWGETQDEIEKTISELKNEW